MPPRRQEWNLEPGNEWVGFDPFGKVKPGDVSSRTVSVRDDGGVSLRAARNGYASFRLFVAGKGQYRLSARMADEAVEVDLFRAWYHRMPPAEGKGPPRYFADALVPVPGGVLQELPDPDNDVPDQVHQEYWVDLFVPADARVGTVEGRVVLTAGDSRIELPVRLEVLPLVSPDADAVVTDHNSYGCRWIHRMYPGAFAACADWPERWARTIEIMHHYFRICHEHRGMLSNLGHGHAGTFDPIYGPKASGSGREKSLTDWELFDRHYGPLLDGSAFATASPGAPRPRRPAKPVWGVYTPINPDWPADYLWWGQPGYEAEFVRCVGQFDRHFRDRNWLAARPYLFFNHKKRYRWFEWDGDEPKYAKDDGYFLAMDRLFKKAVGDTPVPWLFRCDASWQMKNHFTAFAGAVNFWVCGGFAAWYPQEIAGAVRRGDVVWTYGGTPAIDAPSTALFENVYKTWARGLTGHCDWLTVDPGPDPWFACEGAGTGIIYPGERFGIAGPIPSIRLKLRRNAVQDINLIDAAARSAGRLDQAREQLTRRVPIRLWQAPPPIAREQPPEVWDSRNLTQPPDETMARHQVVDPLWWADVRAWALEEDHP